MKTSNILIRFLDTKTEWSNWKLMIFKWAIFTTGLLFGIYFKDIFGLYIPEIGLICILTLTFSSYWWLSQINKNYQ